MRGRIVASRGYQHCARHRTMPEQVRAGEGAIMLTEKEKRAARKADYFNRINWGDDKGRR